MNDEDAFGSQRRDYLGHARSELVHSLGRATAPVFVPQVAQNDGCFARFKWIVDRRRAPISASFKGLDPGAQVYGNGGGNQGCHQHETQEVDHGHHLSSEAPGWEFRKSAPARTCSTAYDYIF